MDFRQIEIFCAVAEELHFGRAARRLFIAQGSVSEQIRRLETHLGTLLFHRSSRSVVLTPAGRVLLAESHRLLDCRDRAVQLVRAAGAGRAGALRLAANYPASRMLLLPLLDRLRETHPEVAVTPRELASAQQFREVGQGDLDLGLVYGPVDDTSLRSEHLLDVPMVAVVRGSHPLAGTDSLRLDELAAHRYVTTYAGGTNSIEETLISTAARVGVRVRRSQSTTDLSGYLLELETTDTIGFSSLPRGEQSRAQGMHLLRLEPQPMLTMHAVWRADRDEPLVNSVLSELRELAAAHGERHSAVFRQSAAPINPWIIAR
ncbi:LysR family transcriptional regulator [Nocardia jinanensis]|uniref:LysR family transcriptional regulator n=1 Tax=Nocardia jinanensis TaxID=382504 RepID=A0A917S0W3_9NOCA|nr:LysR family transcriptional regulator [Nocardia jinanensis]GGL45953.1 LysR family transcriptional regulator [Nocardia jinanensis]